MSILVGPGQCLSAYLEHCLGEPEFFRQKKEPVTMKNFWDSGKAACQQLKHNICQRENDVMSSRSILLVTGVNSARNKGSITAFSSR